MANIKGPLQLTRKHNASGIVFVDGRNGINTRSIPAAGIHKDETALKENYTATAGVNKFAGSINTVMKFYGETFIDDIYGRLLSLFFTDNINNRLLRLKRTEGMEGHPRNKLESVMQVPTSRLKINETTVTVPLRIINILHKGRIIIFTTSE